MNRKKKRHSLIAFLLVFVLCFQVILPASNPPAVAASSEVSSEYFSMTSNSFTFHGTTITKAQLVSALSGAKRLPAGWQSNAARMGILEYTQSPAFDPKVQAGLAGIGLGVATIFAKISFQLNLSTITNTEWYIMINGMPFIVKCTSSGLIINNISVPFNWLTYELAQYFSGHMNDWYELEDTEGESETDTLPNQGTVQGDVAGAPPVDAGKQGKHVPGHNNNDPNKSQWPEGQTGVNETQQGWQEGTQLPDGTKVWDSGKVIGPNGETGVRVHIDGKGNIHGYPVNPSQYLPNH